MPFPRPLSQAATIIIFSVVGFLGAASTAFAGDIQPPTITVPRDTTVYPDVPITLQVLAKDDDSGVQYCILSVDGVQDPEKLPLIDTSSSGDFYGRNQAFDTIGEHRIVARCVDRENNEAVSRAWIITAVARPDVTAPTVDVIASSNSITTEGSVTLTGTYSDASLVNSCRFLFNGSVFATVPAGTNSGSVFLSRGSMTAGTYTYSLDCQDAAGNTGTSVSRTLTVTAPAPDATPPVLGAVTPTTATVGSAITLSVTYSDASNVSSCSLSVDGSSLSMQLSGTRSGTATRGYTFSSAGTYALVTICSDSLGNIAVQSGSITVSSAPSADTSAPTLSLLQPSQATRGTGTTLSAQYSDNIGVTACSVDVDGVFAGSATLNGLATGTASRAFTFSSTGVHTVKFSCRDAAGNTRESSILNVNVSEPTSPATFPTIGFIGTTSAVVNSAITLSATASDSGSGIGRCDLLINGTNQGSMTTNGITASRVYTFVESGSYTASVRCWNGAGNLTNGPAITITVSSASVSPTVPTQTPTPATPTQPAGNPSTATLIKLSCPRYTVAADHPCKAVYYYGTDGRRHAFPNAQVYFTWFNDFSSVREVSDGFMASLPLGRNVRYRPGIRMVKFTTLNNVYAVSRGGTLRWVMSEDVARSLYGTTWARQIDDIADIFFTDYTFGADIGASAQFSAADEAQRTTSIDQNW